MKTILFICTGNICRSPMAAGLMQHKLEREGRAQDLAVGSAGVWTVDGRRASEYSISEMASRQIDISRHQSRSLTAAILREADLVLTMTRNHAEAIRAEFPAYARRVYTLAEMAGREFDIQDPIGGAQSDYARAAEEIETLIEEGYPQIMGLLG